MGEVSLYSVLKADTGKPHQHLHIMYMLILNPLSYSSNYLSAVLCTLHLHVTTPWPTYPSSGEGVTFDPKQVLCSSPGPTKGRMSLLTTQGAPR
jgi:hypothetical protein